MADGSYSGDAQFRQVTTLFLDLPTPPTSFTWTDGLDSTGLLLFFDISDETDPGGNKGSPLPPPPPTIDPSTNVAGLYIGSSGTIIGTNYSTILEENFVCFEGGPCIQPDTGTTTQLDFTVPPGATSGPVRVQIADRLSNSVMAGVRLESPSILIRSIGFSEQDTSYWMGGRVSGINSLFRAYHDMGTGTWLREDRGGIYQGNVLYCSTQTSRDGVLYCALGTTAAAGGTRRVDTDTANNLGNCISLGGGTSNVRGAAADPNPNSVAGRDVAYFAHAASNFNIKKVAGDCSSVLDSNYGNTNWGAWNSIVGMAVDPENGDLYMAADTDIYKIDTSENVTLVKGGFSDVLGIDIIRDGPADPGWLLVADNIAGQVVTFALDNTGATPATVASPGFVRAVNAGLSVFSGPLDPSNPANVGRNIFSYNGGNSLLSLLKDPAGVTDQLLAGKVWISSWDVNEPPPPGQKSIRFSDADVLNTAFSTVEVEMTWIDGVARDACAWVGDPGRAMTGYENTALPAPTTPANCDYPWLLGGNCDNNDNMVVGGVGSFGGPQATSSDPLKLCLTACGSVANPCKFEFHITKRFAGDNFRLYFSADPNATTFKTASPMFTAWKRLRIENDPMYKRGGLLWEDFVRQTPCPGADPDCNKRLLLYDWADVFGRRCAARLQCGPHRSGGLWARCRWSSRRQRRWQHHGDAPAGASRGLLLRHRRRRQHSQETHLHQQRIGRSGGSSPAVMISGQRIQVV